MVIHAAFAEELKSNPYWSAYFNKKMHDLPSEFVVAGLKKLSQQGNKIAIDLGAGVGHETLLLLQKGYNVIAIDGEQNAFEYMNLQPGIQKFHANLRTIVSSFENIDYTTLPAVDLVVASFSLPFVAKKDFETVWTNVVNKIKPGGYFIGNLFDPGFTFFGEKFRPKMSFHTKEQAFNLFNRFTIVEFKEINAPSINDGTYHHYYVIIAKKI